MADAPVGITFMPSAEAAANGPRQAGIEGTSGSDLAQAFKILSLHLPRVLGASAIAPKTLLTSPGAAGVAAPSGVNPYSAVFQALLQSMGAGSPMGGSADAGSAGMPTGGDSGSMDVASLASLFAGMGASGGSSSSQDMGQSGYGGLLPSDTSADIPAPRLIPGHDYKDPVGLPWQQTNAAYNAPYVPEPQNPDTQYF